LRRLEERKQPQPAKPPAAKKGKVAGIFNEATPDNKRRDIAKQIGEILQQTPK